MNTLKSYFLIPYIVITIITVLHSIYSVFALGLFTPWLGATISILPFVIFVMLHMSQRIARTSEHLGYLILFSIIGTGLAFSLPGTKMPALFYAGGIGLIGNLLYIYWYSLNDRPPNPLLDNGKTLPTFTLKTINGELVTSTLITSKPSLILFYRGNWCPLCIKQIKEISDISHQLCEENIDIYLIGAQSLEETKKIAAKYTDKPMQFLFDPFSRAMAKLDLIHIDGKPKGMIGYDKDTVYPTVIFTDRGGKILWTDQSDNYRLRPEPEIFLNLRSNFEIA